MAEYEAIAGFEEVYLEDSFVLDAVASYRRVRIRLEAVLTERHPRHRPPPPDLQYCYLPGTIEFTGVDRLEWAFEGGWPATDAAGEADYGNITEIAPTASGYRLLADLGTLHIVTTSPPTIRFDGPASG